MEHEAKGNICVLEPGVKEVFVFLNLEEREGLRIGTLCKGSVCVLEPGVKGVFAYCKMR